MDSVFEGLRYVSITADIPGWFKLNVRLNEIAVFIPISTGKVQLRPLYVTWPQEYFTLLSFSLTQWTDYFFCRHVPELESY
jgi:hypothetical protein